MTVRINKPALNLREELTKAQGVVRYEQRQFWMDGLVENGTFDTDTSGWTAINAVISVDNGVLVVDDTANAGSDSGAYQALSTVVGKRYTLSVEFVSTTSAFFIAIGDSTAFNNVYYSGDLGTTSRVFTHTFIAQSSSTLIRLISASTGVTKFDNVQVFEVDENDNVIHSVPLGFKPVHVYEDGLLQREGDNHDYTVVNTGFGYQIKPTVAPSATTETCIIAEREL